MALTDSGLIISNCLAGNSGGPLLRGEVTARVAGMAWLQEGVVGAQQQAGVGVRESDTISRASPVCCSPVVDETPWETTRQTAAVQRFQDTSIPSQLQRNIPMQSPTREESAEFRKHPLRDHHVVIVNSGRNQRPTSFSPPQQVKRGSQNCPFCEGNEHLTPEAVYSRRRASTDAGWSVRVFPNKFPILMPNDSSLQVEKSGVYQRMSGASGRHYVLVESGQHDVGLHSQDILDVAEVLYAYRTMMQDLKRDPQIAYVQIFKNEGALAGASLEHPHSQLVAMPFVPAKVAEELATAHDYYALHGACIFCDMLKQELSEKVRVVAENDHFISFCAYAPNSAFETWIMPKSHESNFEDLSTAHLMSLAELLRKTLVAQQRYLGGPAYNLMLMTSPVKSSGSRSYHWRLEVAPQLSMIAGLERGAGVHVVTTTPENAAAALREVESAPEA